MWSRVARRGSLLVVLLAQATAARAQDAGTQPAEPRQAGTVLGSPSAGSPSAGSPSAGSPSAGSPSAGSPSAGSPFEAALSEADRRFVAGDLQGALAVLQPACVATDSAECAFSLGAIQHGLGHCPEALAHYRRYLQLAPRGEHVPEVSAALEEVEGRCGSPVAPAAPLSPVPVEPLPAPVAATSPAEPLASPPPPAVAPPSSLTRGLTSAAFVASGAAAVSGVVFGVLAARSARRCDRADTYDQRFIDECEVRGPRYQGLWQGSAIASTAFLGVGVALWWSSSRAAPAAVPAGVSGASGPGLALHGHF